MTALLIVEVAGERLGVSVDEVHHAVSRTSLQPLPGAHGAVAGFVSLRGRVATAVDLAVCLDLRPSAAAERGDRPAVVIQRRGELFALLVDGIEDLFEPERDPLDGEAVEGFTPRWRHLVRALHPDGRGLVAELDVERVLAAARRRARENEPCPTTA